MKAFVVIALLTVFLVVAQEKPKVPVEIARTPDLSGRKYTEDTLNIEAGVLLDTNLDSGFFGIGTIWPVYSSYESIWSTAVINPGDSLCAHVWVEKPKDNSQFFTRCAVFHDIRGCSNNWGYRERICEKCLRKEADSEMREISKAEVERVVGERRNAEKYKELEKRINGGGEK